MMRFFTARTIKNKIGLPVAQTEQYCTPYFRKEDGKTVYSIDEARKIKAVYLAGKTAVAEARKARRTAGICFRKLPDGTLCPNKSVPGYPYCPEHLPPSARKKQK